MHRSVHARKVSGAVLPILLKNETIEIGRLRQNITIRLSAGKRNHTDSVFLRLGFSEDTDLDTVAEQSKLWVNTLPIQTRVPLPHFHVIRGYETAPYPCLPPEIRKELVYRIPVKILNDSFNAIEFEPPPVRGELLWGEFLILPEKNESEEP